MKKATLDLHAQAQAIGDRHENVDELVARLARPEIDGDDVREKSEGELASIAQRAQHRVRVVARHVDGRLRIDRRCRFDGRAWSGRLQQRGERVSVHQASFC